MAAKKIVDVAHPGKSAPAENSKSVIITKHTVVQDPMVVEDTPSSAPVLPAKPSTKKKVIQPLTPTEKPVEPAPTAANPAPTDKEAAPTPPEVPISLPSSPSPVADQGDKGVPNEDAQEAAKVEANEEHDIKVQKLIDSKHYYLPITSLEQRRSKRTVIVGLVISLILALAWVNVALDAGIIQINGIEPLTHFFSKQQ